MTVVKNRCCEIAEAARAYVASVVALEGSDSPGMLAHVLNRDACWFELVKAVDPDLLDTFGASGETNQP